MGTSRIFSWMNHYYAEVRRRSDWDALSFEERVAALKKHIADPTDGSNAANFATMDRADRWPRAMTELEQSWQDANASD